MRKRIQAHLPWNRPRKLATKCEEESRPASSQTEKSQHDPLATTSLGSLEASLKQILPRDLWEEAYKKVQQDHPDVLDAYTKVLLGCGSHKADENAIQLGGEKELQDIARQQLDAWDSNQLRLHFHGKDVVIREQAQKVVKIVLSVKDVVSAAISAEPHAALAWAGVLVILPVLGNLFQQDSDAMDGFEYISTLLVRCRYVDDDPDFQAAMTSAKTELLSSIQDKTVDLYYQVYIYQIRLVVHFSLNTISRYCQNATGSLGDNSWSQMLNKLKSTSQEINADLETLTRGKIFEVGSQIDKLSKIEKLLEEQRKNAEHRKLELGQILRALSYSKEAPFDSFKNSTKPRCLEKTQMGPLKTIREWCESESGETLLWFYGMAGTGKSTIARTTAWALHTMQWPDGSTISAEIQLGGSFFFDQRDPTRNTTQYLFPTLATCLADALPSIRPYVVEAIGKDTRIEEKGLHQQWESLIVYPLRMLSPSQAPQHLVIVIDSLDECEDKDNIETMLTLFGSLKDLPSTRLRVLMTSRPETHIGDAFNALSSGTHWPRTLDKIPPEGDDIKRFLENELVKIATKYNIREWPGQESIERLRIKSEGLFIYASTCCKFLDDKYNYDTRLQAIFADDVDVSTPQEGLDRMYAKILSLSLEGKTTAEKKGITEDFRLIVGCIMLVFKPVSSITLGTFLFGSYQQSERRIKRVIEPLGSLLDGQSENDLITPVHLSFRDFLLAQERCKSAPEFGIDSDETHLILLYRCFETMENLEQNMAHLELPDSCSSDMALDDLESYVPLPLQYSCRYWIDHLAQLNSRQRNTLLNEQDGIVHKFMQTKLLFWLEALSLMREVRSCVLMLQKLEALAECAENPGLTENVHDASRFLLSNRHTVEQAPLQIYSSALIFSPMKSLVRQSYFHLVPHWIKERPIMEDRWTRELLVIENNDAVLGVTFSPGGEMGASISCGGRVSLWDAATGQEKFHFNSGPEWGEAIAFSKDGTLLAFEEKSGKVALWKFATGEMFLVGHESDSPVWSIAFSPTCNIIVLSRMTKNLGAWDNHLEVWDYHSRALLCATKTPSEYSRVAFLSTGRVVAAGDIASSKYWSISILDLKSGEFTLGTEGHVNSDCFFAFSENRARVAIVDGATVRIWEAETGVLGPRLDLPYGRYIHRLAISGNLIAAVFRNEKNETIHIWDYVTSTEIACLQGQSAINQVSFSTNGRTLASGAWDKTVRLWNIVPGGEKVPEKGSGKRLRYKSDIQVLTSSDKPRTTIQNIKTGHCHCYKEELQSLEFSPHAQMLALKLADKTVQLWDAHLENQSSEIENVEETFFSSDSRMAAFTSKEMILIVNTDTWEETTIPTMDSTRKVLFSHRNQFVAWRTRDSIYILDLTNMKLILSFSGYIEWPGIAFSPDTESVAISGLRGGKGGMEIWQLVPSKLRTGFPLGSEDVVQNPIFSANGAYVAIRIGSWETSRSLVIYEIATGRKTSTVCAGRHSIWYSMPGTVSSSGMIAVALDNLVSRSIAVINAATGEMVHTFQTNSNFQELSFSEDGQYIECDRGVLPIPPIPNGAPARPNRSLWVGEEWITQGGRNLLWLPHTYRGCLVTVEDESVFLHHESGSIQMLKIDLENTPLVVQKLLE